MQWPKRCLTKIWNEFIFLPLEVILSLIVQGILNFTDAEIFQWLKLGWGSENLNLAPNMVPGIGQVLQTNNCNPIFYIFIYLAWPKFVLTLHARIMPGQRIFVRKMQAMQ